MPDAEEKLSNYTDYPISNLLTGVGIVIVLTLQQITIALSSKSKHDNSEDVHDHNHDHHYDSVQDPLIATEKPPYDTMRNLRSPSQEVSMHTITAVIHDHDHGVAAFQDVMNAKTLKDLINAYALEISTTVHSLVIGFNLGLMDSDDSGGIITLMTALAFHQFVEGIGMGSVIHSSRRQLGEGKLITFVVIFSFTISIGVLIGIIASAQDETDTQVIIEGSITGIAAGSLMYIALTELVSSYFNDPAYEHQQCLKGSMLMCFALGIAIMAMIGVWA